MRRRLFVLVGVSAHALAACGSDDGGGTTTSTGTIAATGSNAGETGPRRRPRATSGKDCEDLTGEGATFTIKFSSATSTPTAELGTYDFLCTIHPPIAGRVSVVA